MPELPEVEVVRRGLEAHLRGRTFDAVEVYHPRAVRDCAVDLARVLPGQTVTATGRRGKFMWLVLDGGSALLIHLRMSGQMLVGKPGGVVSPHLRIRARLGDVELCFVDQRTFGSWQYVALGEDGVPTTMGHIAPDPFEASFDDVSRARLIRTKRSAIKSVLLDQGVISGIGSIYADEALWAAQIKPTRRARSLRQRDALRLIEQSRAVMASALEQGGTSFDSLYVNVNGASGYFSRSLNAYGRAGRPCRRCGEALVRVVVGGRSSSYCPGCQTL
ncbi:bifunctional DNA-formamidopyrimidine glycosylase/DNA-(apurinic or apyrimidinic site) lyase [Corynebacterium liangguodongii]|uniref:Formamidopyrimidine-DNA glycosylase n=1 Tax=Corynebacterium liangguodongii TaxID=2079535 RepID=A0A2S0WEU3_9CORY|nr:bifunctional DNA-formamidopyrimidine glycosylase/DNA-(apurinic or apyrimidinic site) lyase [Corynebacterium liangguodongii]AWB84270.1 DNA-formamidopyrimidine glycosylase [Corynebacterium liangguodongii]PWC00279.1 bifunctional DNA-formamidopyrimidine glycosylase/DNA-(apurinic or apyrimidinic site) lyase [Corynebacterium liangguodongii]